MHVAVGPGYWQAAVRIQSSYSGSDRHQVPS